jgi:hypothetical protein
VAARFAGVFITCDWLVTISSGSLGTGAILCALLPKVASDNPAAAIHKMFLETIAFPLPYDLGPNPSFGR